MESWNIPSWMRPTRIIDPTPGHPRIPTPSLTASSKPSRSSGSLGNVTIPTPNHPGNHQDPTPTGQIPPKAPLGEAGGSFFPDLPCPSRTGPRWERRGPRAGCCKSRISGARCSRRKRSRWDNSGCVSSLGMGRGRAAVTAWREEGDAFPKNLEKPGKKFPDLGVQGSNFGKGAPGSTIHRGFFQSFPEPKGAPGLFQGKFRIIPGKTTKHLGEKNTEIHSLKIEK